MLDLDNLRKNILANELSVIDFIKVKANLGSSKLLFTIWRLRGRNLQLIRNKPNTEIILK